MQQMTTNFLRVASIAAAMFTIFLLTGSESQAGIGALQKKALADSSIVHADGTRDHVSGGGNDGDDNQNGSNRGNDGNDDQNGSNGDNDGDDDRNGRDRDNDGDDHRNGGDRDNDGDDDRNGGDRDNDGDD